MKKVVLLSVLPDSATVTLFGRLLSRRRMRLGNRTSVPQKGQSCCQKWNIRSTNYPYDTMFIYAYLAGLFWRADFAFNGHSHTIERRAILSSNWLPMGPQEARHCSQSCFAGVVNIFLPVNAAAKVPLASTIGFATAGTITTCF